MKGLLDLMSFLLSIQTQKLHSQAFHQQLFSQRYWYESHSFSFVHHPQERAGTALIHQTSEIKRSRALSCSSRKSPVVR